jgi:hypothetical protein
VVVYCPYATEGIYCLLVEVHNLYHNDL